MKNRRFRLAILVSRYLALYPLACFGEIGRVIQSLECCVVLGRNNPVRIAAEVPAMFDQNIEFSKKMSDATLSTCPCCANLDEETTAITQASVTRYKTTMGEVAMGSPFVFPSSAADDLIKSLSVSSPGLFLIFEGAGIGFGDLVLRLKKNGVTICESAPVFLDLKDIKKMYEHYTIGDTATMAVSAIPAIVANVNGFSYTSSSPDETDYLLFVHGWRMLPWERRYFAETAYKRLFWAKYRGRFGFFSWPTEWCSNPILDPGNYNRSEEKAWHSAAGLRNLLQALNSTYPGKVRVMAHSMGNVVTSEALRQEVTTASPVALVATYIASQAASVAHAYDDAARSIETDESTDTPEVYAAYPPTGFTYFFNISSVAAGNIVNFCNSGDYALSSWEINQDLKPSFSSGYDYEYVGLDFSQKRWTYDPFGFGSFVLDFPTDRYAIYSFIAEARSLALGADASVAGEVGSTVNLGAWPYSFGTGSHEHSAQFLSTVMRRASYWQSLLSECGITTP